MKRSEKIDLIKSGKYIIENDMKGSEVLKSLLRKMANVDIDWSLFWCFYGLDFNNRFCGLYLAELNDRPRFKMSELVEMEEPKEVFTVEYVRSIPIDLSYESIAYKLNQMAFYAYKTK